MAQTIGMIMIVCGLGLAGFVAYEVWGSRPGPRRTTNTPDNLREILDRLNDTEDDDE